MSIKKKKMIFKILKKISKRSNYEISDLETVQVASDILDFFKEDRKKDIEYSKTYSKEKLISVDEVLSDDGWAHYCSSHIWAGPDFIESQIRKGVIKSYDYYLSNKKFI